jgi:hypothetical protein
LFEYVKKEGAGLACLMSILQYSSITEFTPVPTSVPEDFASLP